MTDPTVKNAAIVPASFYPDFSQRQYPNVQIAGQRYAMLPQSDVEAVRALENELRNLKANRLGWQILLILAGALGFGLLVAVVGRALAPQVVQVEKPVYVERHVPVKSNCIAFCGN